MLATKNRNCKKINDIFLKTLFCVLRELCGKICNYEIFMLFRTFSALISAIHLRAVHASPEP
jgi:hypothetical protein